MIELNELVERSRTGDLEAFAEVVRRFQDMAHGYAHSILGDFHLAEDAAQEAFVDAYYKLDALREPAAFPGWFRRIVFKHCDRAIQKKRVPTVPLEEGMSVAGTNEARSELQERGARGDSRPARPPARNHDALLHQWLFTKRDFGFPRGPGDDGEETPSRREEEAKGKDAEHGRENP